MIHGGATFHVRGKNLLSVAQALRSRRKRAGSRFSEPHDLKQADHRLHAEHAQYVFRGISEFALAPPVITTGETYERQIANGGNLFPARTR